MALILGSIVLVGLLIFLFRKRTEVKNRINDERFVAKKTKSSDMSKFYQTQFTADQLYNAAIKNKNKSKYEGKTILPTSNTTNKNNDGDFVTSMAVAAATDSAMVGYLVGGNLSGALVGDALGHSSHSSSSSDSSSSDWGSSSSGSDSSYDSGSSSSWDSGSSSGFDSGSSSNFGSSSGGDW